MKYIIFLVLCIQLFGNGLKAQEPLDHPPTLHVDSTGQVIANADAPAYFFISPAEADGQLMLVPSSDKAANPMNWDGHGNHYLVHRDLIRNMNIRFKVLADGVTPSSTINFTQGLVFHINNNFFAEVGAAAVAQATDAMSGVKETFVSVDGESFKPFIQPVTFDKEGEFVVKIYSVDNVGNVEQPRDYKVITTTDAVVQMDNIYFDINSTRLRPESVVELNKLANLLMHYKDIHLEIRAHTDSRGDANYNLALSNQRAQAAVNYLVSKGIPSSRLSSKGYGETILLNECAEGVPCPEEKHKLNRRIEFLVSKID